MGITNDGFPVPNEAGDNEMYVCLVPEACTPALPMVSSKTDVRASALLRCLPYEFLLNASLANVSGRPIHTKSQIHVSQTHLFDLYSSYSYFKLSKADKDGHNFPKTDSALDTSTPGASSTPK